MSAARQGEALAVVELALAVYRQPARHAELLRGNGALPSGLAVLLRLAGGTEAQELDHGLAALAPESELRKAALFFVEEVLFQREASYYRVLGLNQGATAEQIKEHHRLLMRLFHPDRSTQGDERREHFATRANLAYNTLRDAESRSRYDESLRPPPVSRMQTPRHAAPGPRRPVREPDSYWAIHVYPKLMRHLPQWVLAGTALVSVTVVGAVYLFNPPVALPHAEPAPSLAHVEARPATMKATAGDEATADKFESRLIEAGQAADVAAAKPARAVAPPTVQELPSRPAAVAAAGSPNPAPMQPRRQPLPVAPVAAPQTKTGSPATAKPVPPVQPTAVSKAAAVPAVSPMTPPQSAMVKPAPAVQVAAAPQAAAEPVRASVDAAPPVEAPPSALRAELPDPNTLLAKFLEAYEKGDMQTCMALLDDGMRAKPELRREYDALFRNTDLRHVKVLNMNWSREGDSIRGEGQYRSTMMRKGETVLRSQGGQIRIELVRRGGTALINDLQYIASSRS